jgi:DNA polymerase I-like protein with 3'-5' exonuclease and polymerase domains
MNILTLDFETYYSQEFSLTKVTNEEYVRSPEFEVIGVSVQVNSDKPEWFSGPMEQIAVFLRMFNWEANLALAHNAAFDASILTWVFGIKPKGWLDTLSMGRALHGTEVGGSLAVLAKHYGVGTKGDEVIMAKGLHRTDFPADQLARYGEYCCNDTAMTYALFQKMVVDFPPSELRLIDLTIRMFSEPRLWLDAGVLESHLTAVRFTKQELMNKMLIEKDQLMSNNQLAKVLGDLGVEVPMKKSPTTGKQTYAFSKTDEGFKALLEHENVIVQAIVAARLGVKSTIEETRTARFIGIAGRGPMPVPLRYYAAHTGRWGGDDKLNLQNLPRKSPLKIAIIPPDGHVILDSDSSQIEARTLAWLAGQDDLVDAFDRGEDVYKIMASAIYGKPADEITKDERFVGKTTILGAGYGMGAAKFKLQLKSFGVDVELEEAKRIIDTYRATYPEIVKLWATAGNMLKAILQNQQTSFGRGNLLQVDGSRGIRLPNGLYLKYPNLRLREDEESGKVEVVYDTKKGKAVIPNRIYGGKVIENVCQALARIVIGEQMLMVDKKHPVVMTVHDAIATVVPTAEAETAKEYVELCMRLRPSWAPELPLNCEAGYGDSYGEC